MIDHAIGAALILLAAILYSAVGHGGASAYLAVMALLGVAPDEMRPTALLLNVFVSAIATLQFARAGHFDRTLFLSLAIGSIPAAFVGGRTAIPPDAYRTLVGVVLLISAARFLVTLDRPDARGERPPPLLLALVGATLGFVAGVTGVGGGIFLSPLLIMTRWADLRTTAATSAAFILVNSLAGLAGQAGQVGNVTVAVAWWIPAAVIGGAIGSLGGSRKLSGRGIRVALAGVLVVAGIKLIGS